MAVLPVRVELPPSKPLMRIKWPKPLACSTPCSRCDCESNTDVGAVYEAVASLFEAACTAGGHMLLIATLLFILYRFAGRGPSNTAGIGDLQFTERTEAKSVPVLA